MAQRLLDAANRADVEGYLIDHAVIQGSDLPTAVATAGPGNMNLVLRVTTASGRSIIVKQGRPWVEKYPAIPAPAERTLVEAAFYEAVKASPGVAAGMPALLHVVAADHVIVLEDVGKGGDFTALYNGEMLAPATLLALLDWLELLCGVTVAADARATFANRAMRALNHEHIFQFPLADANGLDLDGITPGLRDEARMLATDREYRYAVATLGHRYLEDRGTLVHGDYFPGSWLKAADGIRVIDPEFCFMGDPEFDCGVLAAHLILAASDASALETLVAAVEARGLDRSLVVSYTGVEIMRRLIGVAQLPLPYGIERKQALLRQSRKLLVEPHRGFA